MGTPISTSSPPLILRVTRPVIISPSLYLEITRSQPRMRSALRLDNLMRPESSSTASNRTSISSPIFISDEPSNSNIGIMPSDLNPQSTTTLSPTILSIFPLRTEPTPKSLTDSEYMDSIFFFVSSALIIAATSLSISATSTLYSFKISRSII